MRTCVRDRAPCTAPYAYLLGQYLGDGCLTGNGRAWQLRISCDAAHPKVAAEAELAISMVVPHGRVHRRRPAEATWVALESGWKHWDRLLPQHGPGPKHTRPIVLADWQRDIVDADPRPFLRGLIHSDGCRTVNRFTTKLPSGRVAEYAYARCFFSNLSADIRGLFCDACDQLGIRWTQSNHRNISVAHRPSARALDAFVGPKG